LENLNNRHLVAIWIDWWLRVVHLDALESAPSVAFRWRAQIGFGADQPEHIARFPGRQSETACVLLRERLDPECNPGEVHEWSCSHGTFGRYWIASFRGVVRNYHTDAPVGGYPDQLAHEQRRCCIVVLGDAAQQRDQRVKDENVGFEMIQLGVQLVPSGRV
jgi:hypothetical protein